MKKQKKSLKNKVKIIAFALMVASIAIPPLYASAAGNYMDTKYYCEYYANPDEYIATPSRAKRDYTSSYLKNLHSSTTLLTNVYAADRESSAFYHFVEDCSVYKNYPVKAGEAKYLPNWVKERGYNYCSILMKPAIVYADIFEGLWSPDSV